MSEKEKTTRPKVWKQDAACRKVHHLGIAKADKLQAMRRKNVSKHIGIKMPC